MDQAVPCIYRFVAAHMVSSISMAGVSLTPTFAVNSVQAILSHPLALVKLGMFLRDVAAMRQTRKRKPIVLVGPANASQQCLVVAVTCEPMSGEALQVRGVPSSFPPLY